LIAAAVNASATANKLVTAFVPQGAGAGSLSAAVEATNLAGGLGGDNNVATNPMNFLRAQDLASVLELLQDGLNQTSVLTATGGTSTSVQDTGAFTAGQQIGNLVVFTGNTTAALADVEARVVSNTTGALFFAADALPATPAAGDTYRIYGGIADTCIEQLRSGRSLGDAPAANLYGDERLVRDTIIRMIRQLGVTVTERTILTGTLSTGSTTTALALNLRGGTARIDQFKGMKVAVTGFPTRTIVGNDEDGVATVNVAYASAPGAVTFSVTVPEDSADGASSSYTFAPGGQPGNNKMLAELLRQLEAAVVAYTLPT
jgi:hypothetical protein